MCKGLCGGKASYLLGKYPGAQCLDQMVRFCLAFEESAKLFFQSGCAILHLHQEPARVYNCSASLLESSVFPGILRGVQLYSVVLICLSLVMGMLSLLSGTYLLRLCFMVKEPRDLFLII